MSCTQTILFCVPFSGGNRYSFKILEKHCPESIKIRTLELPGRGARFNEPLLMDINDIVNDIFDQIKDQIEGPYALFGHSLGGLVIYLLTNKIILSGLTPPDHLFISGHKAPNVPNREIIKYNLPRNDFFAEISKMNGTPKEILEDNELMNLFEPILRADFKAVETCEFDSMAPIDIPITAFYGTNDSHTYDDILSWRKMTKNTFEMHDFPSGHFFIFDYPEQIIDIIRNKLSLI
jgi:external thioesterase TEII